MENIGDYVLEADELKVLKEIAKEENKTVQELFVEIVQEFIDKNRKKQGE